METRFVLHDRFNFQHLRRGLQRKFSEEILCFLGELWRVPEPWALGLDQPCSDVIQGTGDVEPAGPHLFLPHTVPIPSPASMWEYGLGCDRQGDDTPAVSPGHSSYPWTPAQSRTATCSPSPHLPHRGDMLLVLTRNLPIQQLFRSDLILVEPEYWVHNYNIMKSHVSQVINL